MVITSQIFTKAAAKKNEPIMLLDPDALAEKLTDEEYKELFGTSKPPGTLGKIGLAAGTLAGAAAGGVGGYMLGDNFLGGSRAGRRFGALGGSLGGTLLANWLERKITDGHDSGWLFIGG